MTTATYTITGMTCNHCEASVREEVSEVPGITVESVNKDTGVLEVSSDADSIDHAAILAAVKEAGYTATLA